MRLDSTYVTDFVQVIFLRQLCHDPVLRLVLLWFQFVKKRWGESLIFWTLRRRDIISVLSQWWRGFIFLHKDLVNHLFLLSWSFELAETSFGLLLDLSLTTISKSWTRTLVVLVHAVRVSNCWECSSLCWIIRHFATANDRWTFALSSCHSDTFLIRWTIWAHL